MPSPIALLVVLPLLAVLAHVAWTDLAARRIANRSVLAVLAVVPVQLALLGRPDPWWSAPAAGALVLAVGLLAWRAGFLGGGDVKLAAALAALVGLGGVVEFLLVTALAGGLLSTLLLLAFRFGPPLAVLAARFLPLPVAGRLGGLFLPAAGERPPSVPYGLALAAGGLWWAFTLLGHS